MIWIPLIDDVGIKFFVMAKIACMMEQDGTEMLGNTIMWRYCLQFYLETKLRTYFYKRV